MSLSSTRLHLDHILYHSRELSLLRPNRHTADPKKDPTAEKYSCLTYNEVLEKQLGVMDLTAICLARDHNMPLRVYDMNEPGVLARLMTGGSDGTLIVSGD